MQQQEGIKHIMSPRLNDYTIDLACSLPGVQLWQDGKESLINTDSCIPGVSKSQLRFAQAIAHKQQGDKGKRIELSRGIEGLKIGKRQSPEFSI